MWGKECEVKSGSWARLGHGLGTAFLDVSQNLKRGTEDEQRGQKKINHSMRIRGLKSENKENHACYQQAHS
jgi:hypothetical protein